MPEFTGSTTAKQASKEEWKEWCKREETAQGVLLQTLAEDLYQDVQRLHTAAEKWTYLIELFSLDSNETSELTRQAGRNLRAMRLTDHPTATEMIDHLTTFNKTWADAKRNESRLTEVDRCDLFILSLPRRDQTFVGEYREFRKLLSKPNPPSWLACMKIFEKDVDDRERDVVVASVQRDQHAGRGYIKETHTCNRCDKKGHIGRDCKNPKRMPEGRGGATEIRRWANFIGGGNAVYNKHVLYAWDIRPQTPYSFPNSATLNSATRRSHSTQNKSRTSG
ncbi:hypothetical protein I350_03798 [Cryptococcus amylolentus CBS 6273]|uniref:CCHC-type domain-containing protein n=1 Tax=Cryptococcus amylolentus CBS 6273 TaxID=1296118 RepID=A0A1E3K542_9TREE|nr:hypothetical protein I350_03798 [Cryptococcus amylolentus CBS 6273]